jgi:hypothetical protein
MRRCFLIVYLRIIYLQVSASLGSEQSDDLVNAPDVSLDARFRHWRHYRELPPVVGSPGRSHAHAVARLKNTLTRTGTSSTSANASNTFATANVMGFAVRMASLTNPMVWECSLMVAMISRNSARVGVERVAEKSQNESMPGRNAGSVMQASINCSRSGCVIAPSPKMIKT